MLCIEIDENQHRYYCPKDDITRYNQLFMDFSGKYIFIRYNPDKYTDFNGEKQDPEFSERMETLENEMKKHIERIESDKNQDLLEIYHLYYDE